MFAGKNSVVAATLLTCLAVAPLVYAAAESELVLDTAPDQPAVILRYAPIYADGTLGPWIPYRGGSDPTEGVGCPGRGFDSYEVVIDGNDPCAAACAGGSCLSRTANGAAEGGVDPFCAQTGDAPCPLNSGRFGFQAAGTGSFATYVVGSHRQGFTAPPYAANQPICAIDFTLFVARGPGVADLAGNVIGANSYVDILIRTGAFPDPCVASPVFGPLVGTPSGNVSGPFGNTTAALGNLGTTTGTAVPGGFRFEYVTPVPPATGTRIRFGPIDVSGTGITLAASGTYEMFFWNDAAGEVVSANNQPGLWATKDPFIQGSVTANLYNDNLRTLPNPPAEPTFQALACGALGTTVCSGANELGGLPFGACVRFGVSTIADNDNCATPFLLVPNGTINGTTVGASNDGSASCGATGAADRWYQFIATCNGMQSVTAPAGVTVAAYAGECGALTEVACGESINIAVLAGESRRVRVTTGATPAAYALTTAFVAAPPANDSCFSPIPLSPNTTTTHNNLCATNDGFDTLFNCTFADAAQPPPFLGSPTVGADVWFSYSQPNDGMVQVSLCSGPNFDTVLEVSEGCFAPTIACDDDFCNGVGTGSASQVTFMATANTNYTIRVGGFGTDPTSAQGEFDIFVGDAVSPVSVATSNPPDDHLDTLDTGSGGTVTAGIGGVGTAVQGGIQYATVSVTFDGPVSGDLQDADITVACTGGSCPTASVMSGSGAGPYEIALSSVIPPLHCTTISFVGAKFTAGQQLQYRFSPGNVDLGSAANTQDLLNLILALNNGAAAANPARYNVNRIGVANTQDLLRIIQLLNGILTNQVYNLQSVAACP